jgi:hypothetical protein
LVVHHYHNDVEDLLIVRAFYEMRLLWFWVCLNLFAYLFINLIVPRNLGWLISYTTNIPVIQGLAKVSGFFKHRFNVSNATNSPAVDRLIKIIAFEKPTQICHFTNTPTINYTIFTSIKSGNTSQIIDGFS